MLINLINSLICICKMKLLKLHVELHEEKNTTTAFINE